LRVHLKTKRLLIREFKPSDWKAIHEYGSDPRVVRYMIWGPNTIPQTKAFLRKKIRQQKQNPRSDLDLAVVEKATGLLVGSIGLVVKSPDRQEGVMGYILRRDRWSKGYMTEAAKTIFHWGFRRLKLRRIFATCNVKNKASARVMVKVGMRREALFRENVFEKGRWRDTFLYAILRKEWPSSGC
jgi:RimJ/RimL family protein N-acetyltransferase